jgi:hypothetical protein
MNANSLPALEPCRLYLDESNLALNSNQFKAGALGVFRVNPDRVLFRQAANLSASLF